MSELTFVGSQFIWWDETESIGLDWFRLSVPLRLRTVPDREEEDCLVGSHSTPMSLKAFFFSPISVIEKLEWEWVPVCLGYSSDPLIVLGLKVWIRGLILWVVMGWCRSASGGNLILGTFPPHFWTSCPVAIQTSMLGNRPMQLNF